MARTKSKSDNCIEWEKPENLKTIREWAFDGKTRRQIANDLIGISKSTLYEWMELSSDISDSIKVPVEYANAEAEESVTKSINGYFVTEEVRELVVDEDTGEEKLKTTRENKKWIKPDATLLMWYLMNRDPEKWRDMRRYMQTMDEQTADSGVIVLPSVNSNPPKAKGSKA